MWASAEKAGTIDETGAFQAYSTAGRFQNGVTATATHDGVTKTGVARIDIIPDSLHHIVLTPSVVILEKGRHQDLVADAFDKYDNLTKSVEVSWAILGDGGAIDDRGRLTDGPVPGAFYDTVQVTVRQGNATKLLTGTVVVTPRSPVLVAKDIEAHEVEFRGNNVVRYGIPVSNWEELPADLFEPAPDLAPCGLNTNSSRTWVSLHDAQNDRPLFQNCGFRSPDQLKRISFDVAEGDSPPLAVYVELVDRRWDITFRSNEVSLENVVPAPPAIPVPIYDRYPLDGLAKIENQDPELAQAIATFDWVDDGMPLLTIKKGIVDYRGGSMAIPPPPV